MSARALPAAAKTPAAAPAREPGLRRQSERDASSRRGHESAPPTALPDIVRDVLSGAGLPLDDATRALLEPRIAGDLSAAPVGLSRAPLSLAPPADPLERAADRAAQRALDPAQRAPARAADLRGVRIHTGPVAAQAARSVQARAFTVAERIVFGEDEYRPNTVPGRRLIAHELAHVLQQRGTGTVHRQMVADAPPKPEEKDGDAKAKPEKPGDDETAAADRAPAKADAARPDGAKAAGDKDAPKAGAAAKNGSAKAPKPGEAPAPDDKTDAKDEEPKKAGDLPTGDLALIDEELAEHQRWGAAGDIVGAAGSEKRAAFIAESAAGGGKELKQGAISGVKMGVEMKLAEKAIEKAAFAIALRLGANATKLVPLPGVGAVIGGVMSAIDLAKRDWSVTGAQIAGFGKGADVYEQLANSIEAISTIIEVATAVANVIAGVLGGITVIMWIAAVATAGIISPMAATLTAITVAIGIGTLALDAINAVVLKPLITTFRALHAFASEADPRDVVAQGEAIEKAAGATSGFVGGLAGGLAGGAATEKGLHLASPKPPLKVPPHEPPPPPPPGAGPVVTAEPPKPPSPTEHPAAAAAPVEQPVPAAAPPAEAPVPAAAPPAEVPAPAVAAAPAEAPAAAPAATSEPKPHGPVDERSFAEMNDIMEGHDKGAFGDMLSEGQAQAAAPLPTAPAGTKWKSKYGLLKRQLKRQQAKPAGGQAQHWTKWLAATEDTPAAQRMTPEKISENQSWLQTDPDRPATLMLQDPAGRGTKVHISDRVADVPAAPTAQRSLPGFEPPAERAPNYTTEHRFADNYMIPEAAGSIRTNNPSATPNQVNLWAGGEARWRMEGTPGQGNWGPQPGSPARMSVQQPLLPGGRPEVVGPPPARVAAPADPAQLSLDFDKPSAPSPQLDLFAPKPAAAPAAAPAPAAAGPVAAPEPVTAPAPAAGVPPAAALPAGPPVASAVPETVAAPAPGGPPPGGAAPGGGPGGPVPPQKATRDLPETGESPKPGAPIHERVNPNYPAPPGTPDDLASLQNQIIDTLAARARAEQFAALMTTQETHHKSNQKPLAAMQKGADEAITATTAHERAIANREAANKQKKEREGQAKAKLDDYPSKATKLASLTGPLKLIRGFTGLASSLPDEPDFVLRFKRGVLKINTDATRFISQLDKMDKSAAEQTQQQTARDADVKADAATLDKTGEKAKDAGAKFDETKKSADTMDEKNTDRLQQASAGRKDGQQTVAKMDAQAEEKRAQAKSLAAAMQAWANNHRKARLDALEQTRKRLEAMGYHVTEVRER